VVQKILAALGEADDPLVNDEYLPNKDLPIHYDPDTDHVLNELERERFPAAPESADADSEDDAAELLTALAEEFKNMSPLQKVSTRLPRIVAIRPHQLFLAATHHDHKNLLFSPTSQAVPSSC
jgi:hypothetical protein